MCLVEEERQLGLLRIADLRQALIEFRKHPEQQRGVHAWRQNKFVSGEDVDHSLAAGIGLQQIIEVQRRLAEKLVPALLSQGDQSALNRSDAGGGNVAILRLEFLRAFADVLEHRLQILEVEQQQTVLVGDL